MTKSKLLAQASVKKIVLLFLGVLSCSVVALLHFLGANAAFYIFLVCLVLWPIWLTLFAVSGSLWLWKRWQWAQYGTAGLGAIALIILGQIVGTLAFRGFAADAPTKLKANCERLVPYLESYRTKNKRYPNTLTTLNQFSALPADIDPEQCEYFGKNDDFTLVTDMFWTGYSYYDRETKNWVYVD